MPDCDSNKRWAVMTAKFLGDKLRKKENGDMKKALNLITLMAALTVAALMTGCGDDDQNNNNNTTTAAPVTAPTAANFVGKTYRIPQPDGSTAIFRATSATTYQVTVGGAVVDQGTYTYSATGDT